MSCPSSGRVSATAPGPFRCLESGPRKRFVDGDAEAVQGLVVGPPEIHAVREQDEREVLRWVDPHARAGEPGVAERVDAEERKALRRTEDESDPAPDVVAAVLLGAREVAQLVADDRTVAVHADDRREIRGGPEQARVP